MEQKVEALESDNSEISYELEAANKEIVNLQQQLRNLERSAPASTEGSKSRQEQLHTFADVHRKNSIMNHETESMASQVTLSALSLEHIHDDIDISRAKVVSRVLLSC